MISKENILKIHASESEHGFGYIREKLTTEKPSNFSRNSKFT